MKHIIQIQEELRWALIMNFKSIIIFLVFSSFLLNQENSGYEHRRSGLHNGNLVKTVFGNWGVIGQPAGQGLPGGAWIYDQNGYIGDVSLLVGVELEAPKWDDGCLNLTGESVIFHSVVGCPVSRTSQFEETDGSGNHWGFEPVQGYFNEYEELVAMNIYPSSWPSSWPDKNSEWDGKWNGFFGQDVQNIQQESYYVMNDNNDEEFNDCSNNAIKVEFNPSTENPLMNGLGLEVKVRGMQWQQFQAQDCIFWLYEITNNSTTDYSKVVFGELVGTFIGQTYGTPVTEGDDDWSFFDINENIAYTGDYGNTADNPNWVGDVGMVGFSFLESPGNPYDGIDNDGDASGFGSTPLFNELDFEPTLIENGSSIVTIDSEYNREVVLIEQNNDETIIITTQDEQIEIILGQTELVEGNLIEENGETFVNPNAYDGIDNDLDGLIDENYTLHFHQIKKDQNGNILFDEENPRGYIDYVLNDGINNPMIDEKRDDGIDNDGDWDSDYDDVGQDGVPATGDYGENDGFPTAGEPNFDQTDPDESDQLGLTSFDYFTPSSEFDPSDDEAIWDRLAPGFFDVPESISNGLPISGTDGDFIFSSGYFPLKAGQTERFSIALIYGEDQEDLLRNRETVQLIFDQDYRLAPPPSKPTLHAVPGDGQVTLYWDRIAEENEDPILKEYDFQGYKIYRATDPNFNDVRNITNAHGVIEGYIPLEQFDLKDDIHGYFYPSQELFEQSQGYSFYLGDSTGLVHQFIDTEVQNGRTYYYAVVAYDNGVSDSMFPSENAKLISVLNSGDILLDQNTAYATPSSNAAGYNINEFDVEEHYGPGTGSVSFEMIDETALTGDEYQLTFFDSSLDGADNDSDELIDHLDQDEYIVPITSYYNVFNLSEVTQEIFLVDTFYYALDYKNISEDDFRIEDLSGNLIDTNLYELDFENGKVRIIDEAISNSDFLVKYKYYPIYKSPYIQESPWILESDDTETFDGIRILFDNDWEVNYNGCYWNINQDTLDLSVTLDEVPPFIPKAFANNYTISFFDAAGQSYPLNDNLLLSNGEYELDLTRPTNFKIQDTINDRVVNYVFIDNGNDNLINVDDQIYLFEQDIINPDEYHLSWHIIFNQGSNLDEYNYSDGDSLFISTTKPFRSGDEFYFKTTIPFIDNQLASIELNDVRVVPNPYIGATKFEAPLPPGVASGRGERKIEFRNLPNDASIKIFTARGQHIRTLYHDGNIHSGTVTWDLKTKENLDIAFGVYFYVVESDVGIKKGKIAIIK